MLNTVQKEARDKTKEWLRKKCEETKVQLAKICSSTTALKRAPLPTTVVWNGKGGIEFEKFLDKFTGHVKQQQHMSYILKEQIAILWMKYGDAKYVIRVGMQERVHPSLAHISPSQFVSDTVWLFGAMQQAITGQGKTIIQAYQASEDGILCWKKFLDTYRYDGDVAVYLSTQHQILSVRYSSNYPGGMLQFLEDYESAFMNIEHVLNNKPSTEGITGLYTDQGKRNLFVQNFTVPDLTAELIESVESTTETWEDMVNELRHRLAKCTIAARNEGKRRAHLTTQDTHDSDLTMTTQDLASTSRNIACNLSSLAIDDSYLDSYVHMLAQDWKIGFKL